MTKEIVAIFLPLSEVTEVMGTQKPQRARQPDQYPAVHQKVFQPLGTLETVVDQLAMHAQRMPEQQHKSSRASKQDKGCPAEGQRTTH